MGYSEELCHVFQVHRVEAYLKPRKTVRQLLSVLKDPLKKEHVSGIIYKIDWRGGGGYLAVKDLAAHKEGQQVGSSNL